MKIKKLLGGGIAAGALTLSSIGGAGAAVTFDATTGTGFAGKGDVQLALGLNNNQVQTTPVSFTYEATDTYEATCEFSTEQGKEKTLKTHNSKETTTSGIDSTVAYDARTRKQITGYNLNGFSSSVVSGDPVPVLGAFCEGGNVGDGKWISVALISSTGGLLVNGVPLPITS